MEVRARISRHSLFPLVTEMTVFRHRASVATNSSEMQKILAGINDSIEHHFQAHEGDVPNESTNLPMVMFLDTLSDTQIDHLVRSAVVILIFHVLEFNDHVVTMEELYEGILAHAASEFNAIMGGASIMAATVPSYQSSPGAGKRGGEEGASEDGLGTPEAKKTKRTNHKPEITELLKVRSKLPL
jgi:hypothetical protein